MFGGVGEAGGGCRSGAPNSRLFESTVHPLDLPVRPRMIWLCQPMLNPVRSTEQIEHMGCHLAVGPERFFGRSQNWT